MTKKKVVFRYSKKNIAPNMYKYAVLLVYIIDVEMVSTITTTL